MGEEKKTLAVLSKHTSIQATFTRQEYTQSAHARAYTHMHTNTRAQAHSWQLHAAHHRCEERFSNSDGMCFPPLPNNSKKRAQRKCTHHHERDVVAGLELVGQSLHVVGPSIAIPLEGKWLSKQTQAAIKGVLVGYKTTYYYTNKCLWVSAVCVFGMYMFMKIEIYKCSCDYA